MTVYSGQVSNRRSLGQTRAIVATDDTDLAMAFGITDARAGAVYANGKIGMIQLQGSASHNEAAIDPSEMTRIGNLDYARSHAAAIQDFSHLANSLMMTNRAEMISLLKRIAPSATLSELSDEALGELAKLLVGVGNGEALKQVIAQQDANEVLAEAIKRNAVHAAYQQAGRTGGVDFTVSGRGTTAIVLHPHSVTIRITFQGDVSGSQSAAGAAYKQSFQNIRQAVMRVSRDNQDISIPLSQTNSITANVQGVMNILEARTRLLVRQAISKIQDTFILTEDYNPAGAKARLWRELGLSTSDVPQTGLSDAALRSYDQHKISARQFAELPENGLAGKLTKAISKRLEKANVSALAESVIDTLVDDFPSQSRERLLAKATRETQTYLDELVASIKNVTTFTTAYDMYTRTNQEWEKMIMANVEKGVKEAFSTQSGGVSEETFNAALFAEFSKLVEENADQQLEDFGALGFNPTRASSAVKRITDLYEGNGQLVNDAHRHLAEDGVAVDASNSATLVTKYARKFAIDHADNIAQSFLSDYNVQAEVEALKTDAATAIARTTTYSGLQLQYWLDKADAASKAQSKWRDFYAFGKSHNVDLLVDVIAPDWQKDLKAYWQKNPAASSFRKAFSDEFRDKMDVIVGEAAAYLGVSNNANNLLKTQSKVTSDLLIPEIRQAEENIAANNEVISQANAADLAKEAFTPALTQTMKDAFLRAYPLADDMTQAQQALVAALKTTEPYSDAATPEHWERIVRQVANRAGSQLTEGGNAEIRALNGFLNNGDLQSFVEQYDPDWNGSPQGTISKSLVLSVLQPLLLERAERVWQDFVADKDIEMRVANNQHRLADNLVEEQLPDGLLVITNDLEENPGADLTAVANDYVNENFDDTFIQSIYEDNFDDDQAAAIVSDYLLDNIMEDPQYSKASRGYWQGVIVNASGRPGFLQYSKAENTDKFVETFAPDWKADLPKA